ncbi:recombinase family protein [Vibrio coralliirubri]|uniref:recombinase family protein n=1 Tax=Vibrio coralliirubri TaxID=1516159 RepID=UPI000EFA4AAD|nr:recombinase family protein [Vibrio coralliirubri]
MNYAYCRVSTSDQNIEQQIELLKSKYQIDKVFAEKLSGKELNNRQQLTLLLDIVESGDTIFVQSLDRLGRNTTDILELVEQLKHKQVELHILELGGVDITSAEGKLIISVLASVATMQREQMLEKQAIGIARARLESPEKYKGKQQSPKTTKACKDAVALLNRGLTKEQASKAVGIGVATLYRFLKAREQNT